MHASEPLVREHAAWALGRRPDDPGVGEQISTVSLQPASELDLELSLSFRPWQGSPHPVRRGCGLTTTPSPTVWPPVHAPPASR
jgi:hypothetical protein